MPLRRIFLALAGLTAWTAVRADVDFSAISFWTGNPAGTQRAALVIDWHDGAESSLVWGYRWDGSATGEDLLLAVTRADPRLDADLSNYGTPEAPSYFVDRIDFDANQDGSPNDPGDHSRDNAVFGAWWSYWGSTETDPGTWTGHASGMSERNLADGAIDGWSWDGDWNNPAPEPSTTPRPAGAVPEPSVFTLFTLATALLLRTRRSR